MIGVAVRSRLSGTSPGFNGGQLVWHPMLPCTGMAEHFKWHVAHAELQWK